MTGRLIAVVVVAVVAVGLAATAAFGWQVTTVNGGQAYVSRQTGDSTGSVNVLGYFDYKGGASVTASFLPSLNTSYNTFKNWVGYIDSTGLSGFPLPLADGYRVQRFQIGTQVFVVYNDPVLVSGSLSVSGTVPVSMSNRSVSVTGTVPVSLDSTVAATFDASQPMVANLGAADANNLLVLALSGVVGVFGLGIVVARKLGGA